MPIEISVESGVPLPGRNQKGLDPSTLPQKTSAAAKTARLLAANGLKVAPTHSDEEIAGAIVAAYAEDPDNADKVVTPKRITELRPAALIEAEKILSTFGQQVVESAVLIRHTVTNKLLLETENDDPRVRLKALELLGKISDVGLFAEKQEVTITHKTTEELRSVLREKLERIAEKRARDITPSPTTPRRDMPDIEDADFEEILAPKVPKIAPVEDLSLSEAVAEVAGEFDD